MKRATRDKTVPIWSHWLMLIVTGVLFVLVAIFVDLKPVVDENFFFSTSDPGIRQTKKIERRFPSQPEVILAVSSRDISSQRYLGRIQKLTQRAHTIGGVNAVKSLTDPTPTNLPYDASGKLVNPSGFGAVTAVRPPRNVQLQVRFLF